MGSTLFVRSENMIKCIAVFIKLIEYVKNRSAGITENGVYPLLLKNLKNDLRAV